MPQECRKVVQQVEADPQVVVVQTAFRWTQVIDWEITKFAIRSHVRAQLASQSYGHPLDDSLLTTMKIKFIICFQITTILLFKYRLLRKRYLEE